MARLTRPKNNQVFQIHSILSAILGLLIFIFPHSCGVFFLEGSTKNGIESETGHLLIRMYGILNIANAWILNITSKKATALTKNCLIYGYAFCYVFSFLEICHRSARQDTMNFGFFGIIFMLFYLAYAVVYCWICFTSEDEEDVAESTSNPVFTRYDGGLSLDGIFLIAATGYGLIGVTGVLMPKAYKLIFNTGSLGVGLENGAAICVVRLYSFLLCATGWFIFIIGRTPGQKNRLAFVQALGIYSLMAVVTIVQKNQDETGSIFGTMACLVWGLFHVAMAVACGYYWKKISDASASNNDGTGASSSLSGNNDDEVANDNTPLV
jgi:hypothetical protein